MKSLIFAILGIVLAVIALKCMVSALVCLFSLMLMSSVVEFCGMLVFGWLAKKCFENV